MASKKHDTTENLPTVSKQTAGGITGAVLGGILGGPVGAVAGGVAGAMVGNSSAKGNKPIKKAVESVRSTLSTRKTPTSFKAAKEIDNDSEKTNGQRSLARAQTRHAEKETIAPEDKTRCQTRKEEELAQCCDRAR